MRKAKLDDFKVPVDDVGTFVFGHKSVADQIKIEAEYARLTEGVEIVPRFLHVLSTALADIKVMAVTVPDGWDINAMDGEDDDNYQKIVDVRSAYRKKVDEFRAKPAVASPPAGEGDGGDGGALVPPEVPAATA